MAVPLNIVLIDDAGNLAFASRSARASGLADAVLSLWRAQPARSAVRSHAQGFGWQATTEGQLALFRDILETAHA